VINDLFGGGMRDIKKDIETAWKIYSTLERINASNN
jgi:hypothetical protein